MLIKKRDSMSLGAGELQNHWQRSQGFGDIGTAIEYVGDGNSHRYLISK